MHARERMVTSAIALFRQQGVHRTSVADVLAHSGAPRGSVYHHFRGGKSELAEAATETAGAAMSAWIAATLREHEPAEALDRFVALWRDALRDSDYEAGCPIVAAAAEGRHEPGARRLAGAAFADWEATLRDALARRGVAAATAAETATLVVAAIEGAVIVVRAQRDPAALDRTAQALRGVLTTVLAAPA